ncbi:MAG: hypothetical protein Q9162_006307 [Coniocarpon cinnabarinum]
MSFTNSAHNTANSAENGLKHPLETTKHAVEWPVKEAEKIVEWPYEKAKSCLHGGKHRAEGGYDSSLGEMRQEEMMMGEGFDTAAPSSGKASEREGMNLMGGGEKRTYMPGVSHSGPRVEFTALLRIHTAHCQQF